MTSQCMRAVRSLLAGTALTGVVGLGGCSMMHSMTHWHHAASAKAKPSNGTSAPMTTEAPSNGAAASEVASTEGAPPAQSRTATDSLETPAEPDSDAGTSTSTTVVENVGPELKPSAPKDYVVRHGDTLWAIASMFLRDPWTWPEIWYVNPQIKNPHRIYPGDQLQLALGSNGRMALKLVRTLATTAAAPGSPNARLRPLLRSSPLDTPIETIPYSIIGAFLSHPTVLSTDQIHAAPYVVALTENHNIAGTGHEIFIKQATGEAGARYSVMHVDQELVNPENGHHLGYMAIYTGTAELTQAGPISKAVLTDSARETLQGDVLIPEDHAPVADFVPHVPERPVSGRIIAVVDNVLLAGQDQVVAINRGSDDGLERGHVLTVDQAPITVKDPCAMIENSSTCYVHPSVTLPTDVAGTMLVFRTFAHMSYALILNDTVPMQVGDHVRTP
jgi:LysM repeat protein